MRAVIFVLATAAIACGSTGDERPTPRTHTVTMEQMRFHPESLTVARGDTVVWVNKDLVPHTATSTAGGFDSQLLPAEKSWSFTPQKSGEFGYLCSFHPTMVATLRVE